MTSILLVGAQGQLGLAVQAMAQKKNITLHAFSRAVLDITNTEMMRACFVAHQPTFLINAAAYTAVDLAEKEVTQATQLNTAAARILADLCAEYNCVLIHPSTDYVFDGAAIRPYTEQDIPNPLSVYGASKLNGEKAIQASAAKYIILRVSWVFSAQGKNFVKTILRLAKEKKTLSIVADQIGCPTAASHIAAVIFSLIDGIMQGNTHFGLYHYCDAPAVSWCDFAGAIIACAKKYTTFSLQEIIPIESCDFPAAATRPFNSQLDCTKIEKDYAITRYDWHYALDEVVSMILSAEYI